MAERTRTQKTLTIGKRIFLVLLIMGGVLIGMLKLAEGSKDALRLGLQDYLVKTTGHPSEITSLQRSELFPDIDFLMKGIVVRDSADREKTLVTIDEISVSMPFWKRFVGIVDYKALSLRNMAIATGYILPKKIDLTFAGISASADLSVPAFFIIDGRYNDRDVLLTAEMRRHGDEEPTFDFGKSFPVTFKIGASEALGLLTREDGKTGFHELELITGGQKAFLSIPDIKLVPLSSEFTGQMEGADFSGTIAHQDGLTTMTIDMIGGDPKQVKTFASSFKKDLGLDDDSFVKIIVNPPADKIANTAQKEKSE